MQKPSLGRIVLVDVPVINLNDNNGWGTAPAIITRVWSDTCVNVRVMYDQSEFTPSQAVKTSLTLCETQQEAADRYGCYWPPRV